MANGVFSLQMYSQERPCIANGMLELASVSQLEGMQQTCEAHSGWVVVPDCFLFLGISPGRGSVKIHFEARTGTDEPQR